MIRLKNISVLKKDKSIFNLPDFVIKKGEKILLSGDSGSGKSTLLKTILYFEKFEKQGEIYFEDELVTSSNINEYRSNFSFVNQKAPFFEGSSLDFFKLPLTLSNNHNLSNDNIAFSDHLTEMNLTEDILTKEFTSLSGGEQQRLSILQILFLDKEILLLDEITSALDKTNREIVIRLILDNKRNKDKTIIIVSHNNEEWLKTGKITRIVNIENGEVKLSQVQ